MIHKRLEQVVLPIILALLKDLRVVPLIEEFNFLHAVDQTFCLVGTVANLLQLFEPAPSLAFVRLYAFDVLAAFNHLIGLAFQAVVDHPAKGAFIAKFICLVTAVTVPCFAVLHLEALFALFLSTLQASSLKQLIPKRRGAGFVRILWIRSP